MQMIHVQSVNQKAICDVFTCDAVTETHRELKSSLLWELQRQNGDGRGSYKDDTSDPLTDRDIMSGSCHIDEKDEKFAAWWENKQ